MHFIDKTAIKIQSCRYSFPLHPQVDQAELPGYGRQGLQEDLGTLPRQQGGDSFGPFHENPAVGTQVFFYAKIKGFLFPFQAVAIEVVGQ
jgi:hypothetical protein